MRLVSSVPGHVNAQLQAQGLLEAVLRLLDEAGHHRSAAYAQMALDCLCEPESEDPAGATL